MARRQVKAATGQPFVVRSSRIAGRGGFATRDIRLGERVIEYLGERVTHAVADARYDDHAHATHHTFLFAVSRQTVIDAAVDGNDARFLNHSCDPNCEAVIERSRVFIVAIRKIRAGEELTYDYAFTRDGTETDEEEFTRYGCRCGTTKCRGTILAALPPAELKRRAAAAKKRHHPRHAAARTGHDV